jgi:predicted  nucleic acid-binding Zn-ribbon protein
MDPFSIKLNKQITELETKISESEDAYQDILFEKEALEKENVILNQKIAKLKIDINNLESRYLCCREAVRNFINSNPLG